MSQQALDSSITEKQIMRRQAKLRRSALHLKFSPVRTEKLLVRHFFNLIAIPNDIVVAGYSPIRDEIDILPLLNSLYIAGWQCALPRVVEACNLTFATWIPGDLLIPGLFQVLEPAADKALLRPTLVIVPLLAFDRMGRRLGYGAGCYDRTLATLRRDNPMALAVGVAYAEQEVSEVPASLYDQHLDAVITDNGGFWTRR
jgi:5-formyltetrahydrofolate cyclo-ligase